MKRSLFAICTVGLLALVTSCAQAPLTVTDPTTKKPISDKGSYVTVYKERPDGSWKAVSDIASSATPPGPALPAKK